MNIPLEITASISDAFISIKNQDGKVAATAFIDGNGAYSVGLEAGVYAVEISSTGYESVSGSAFVTRYPAVASAFLWRSPSEAVSAATSFTGPGPRTAC